MVNLAFAAHHPLLLRATGYGTSVTQQEVGHENCDIQHKWDQGAD